MVSPARSDHSKPAIGEEIRRILDQLGPSVGNADTAVALPPACYTSPAWFEFEKRAVWDREWVCLGHAGTIPNSGDYFRIAINDDPMLVVRQHGGVIAVLPAVCQHRGHLLGNDSGNVKAFVCPYHGWTYGLDGALLAAPEMERTRAFDRLRRDFCLKRLHSEIWNGFIFVNLDGKARALGPRLKRITQAVAPYRLGELNAMPTLDIPGNPWNWKWMQENGVELYHVAFAHGGYHDMAPATNAVYPEWREDDDGAIFETIRTLHRDANFTRTGTSRLPPMPGLGARERQQVIFAILLPNMLFTALPDGAFYFVIMPESAQAITLRVGFLYPRSTIERPDFDACYGKVVEDFSIINDQDIAANRSIQIGRRSRFARRGPYSDQEQPLLHLNRWLIRRYSDHAVELGYRPKTTLAAAKPRRGKKRR